MAKTFFFYDLETSGLNAREDRIMQFAGRRTNMDLTPIGKPYNMLVALSDDTLPNPDALMVTGITPQKTVDEGYSEAQFARILNDEIFTPDTIVVGFNNVRFDDEFIRHLLWRNFYDPYEWCWKDGRSRWDMLDVVRMTRALRSEGISWPLDDAGEPTNRLELITHENGIAHKNAHDAMSDVDALIDVTKLIRNKQPQLFEYLLKMRDKKEVVKLVNVDNKKPFVYSSGRYDKEFAKTTVALPLAAGRNGNVVVYDLRYDPTPFIDLSESELAHKVYASWQERQAEDFVKLPAKELQPNRCPAVAPLGVLAHGDGWAKISLDAETIAKHQKNLLAHPEFAEKLRTIFENKPEFTRSPDPEAQLYDGFLNDRDRLRAEAVRNASERELADFHPNFADKRLPGLLLHYKARNFPKTLSDDERAMWQTWRAARVQAQLPKYMAALQRLAASMLDPDKEFIVQELQLWAGSILPEPD
jgi:exodeoxyribonuclease I